MTSREELIEKAAKAIAEYQGVRYDAALKETWDGMARAALAVFEKAHTPTDDERVPGFAEREKRAARAWEFFARDDREMSHDFRGGYHQGMIDGFRRSEVPEPSAVGPAVIAIMPPSPETSKRWYSMYCRECGIEEMMTETADDPRLVARRDEHNRERHAEPQGEPTDAQVLAACRAWSANAHLRAGEAMRAALRAAGEVER